MKAIAVPSVECIFPLIFLEELNLVLRGSPGVFALVFCLGIQACGQPLWIAGARNPVIIDLQNRDLGDPSSLRVIATAGSDRLIVAGNSGPQQNATMVCAEPPVDASSTPAGEPTLPSDAGPSKPPSGVASKIQPTPSDRLSYRSQGLQMLRDQTFQLCIHALQGDLSPAQWQHMQMELISIAGELIKAEIDTQKSLATSRSTSISKPNR